MSESARFVGFCIGSVRRDAQVRAYVHATTIPTTVADEARTLDGSDEVLRLTYAAEYLLHARVRQPNDSVLRDATEDALATLARAGDEAFLSVVANVTGNPANDARDDALARAMWRTGLESVLLEWIESRPGRSSLVTPLGARAGIDAPTVRDHLQRSFEGQDR